ncbi:hypothetical protein GE09DRAFT_371485 [Coniochaeta sp. 2T2.1]|nr:hypothetical protein GE09DRAFT_371485 [Coniochaeta sp. 2T2.1]
MGHLIDAFAGLLFWGSWAFGAGREDIPGWSTETCIRKHPFSYEYDSNASIGWGPGMENCMDHEHAGRRNGARFLYSINGLFLIPLFFLISWRRYASYGPFSCILRRPGYVA